MPGVSDSAGPPRTCAIVRSRVAFWVSDPMGAPEQGFRSSIPSLQIPLSNASSAALRLPSHGSGPEWFAGPSLYDSFIRYSMPVYPGAIQVCQPVGMALRATKGDENLARAHFSLPYVDAADCGHVARLGRAGRGFRPCPTKGGDVTGTRRPVKRIPPNPLRAILIIHAIPEAVS